MIKKFSLKSVLATVLAGALMMSNTLISTAAESYKASFVNDAGLQEVSTVTVELEKETTLKYEGQALKAIDLNTGEGELMCIAVGVDIDYSKDVSILLNSFKVNGKSYKVDSKKNLATNGRDMGLSGTVFVISHAAWGENTVDYGDLPATIESIEVSFTVNKAATTKTTSSSTKKLNTPEISVKAVDGYPVIRLTKWSKSATHFSLYRLNPSTKKYEDMGYALSPGESYTDKDWSFSKDGTAKYKARAVILDSDYTVTAKSDLSAAKSVKAPKPLSTPTFKVKASTDGYPVISLSKWSSLATYYAVYRLNSYSGEYEIIEYEEIGKSYTDYGWSLRDNGTTKYKVQVVKSDNEGQILRESELSKVVSVKALPKQALSYDGKLIKVGDEVRMYDTSLAIVGGTVTGVSEDMIDVQIAYCEAGTLQQFFGDANAAMGKKDAYNGINLFNFAMGYSVGSVVELKASIFIIV